MNSFEDLNPYATIPSKFHKYTIRTLFEQYRDNGGACWVDSEVPECSVTSEVGEITCMTRVKPILATPCKGVYIGPMPKLHSDFGSAISAVLEWLAESIDTGYLWCPPNSIKADRVSSGLWKSEHGPMKPRISDILTRVEQCNFNPLTVSTVHAALESDKISRENVFRDIYPYPRTTIPSTSLFGSSHNNSFIDMSPFEKKKEPDMASRDYKDEYVGFICAPHTSHSYEAGRSMRVAQDVLVRMISYKTYSNVEKMLSRESSTEGERKTWVFYCAGQACGITRSTVNQLCILHRLLSMSEDPAFGLYIKESERICVVNISTGVLTKLCTNGVWSDNVNAYSSDKIKYAVLPHIATSGPDFHRSCLSAHYSYIPFIEHNEAVRTSISSAQITQAVCFPYCPATAAVSPCNITSPIVTTKAYKRIMIEQEETFDPASYMPGENVCVLYHNLDLNYEDAIMVSKRYADNGGFSTVSTCRYLLPPTDYVPPVGKMVCSKLCVWWKSRCQRHCRHTIDYIENCRTVSPFDQPTGTIVSKRILKTGEQSIKVRSYEKFQPGNKLSTGHGQKGICSVLVEPEDMPICYTRSGEQLYPDVIVAVGSIVSRQTVGQIYESGAGINRLKNPNTEMVIEPDQIAQLGEDVRVFHGQTGEMAKTLVKHKSDEDTASCLRGTIATVGYVRMFNQSQMTRERHFTSHRSMKAGTLRTPVKRSKGGALREGEMETQAMVAAGLTNCAGELRRRGDEVVILVCLGCKRLRLLHSCTTQTEFAEITLPYDTVVLDCINKITYNCTFVYTIEPDV